MKLYIARDSDGQLMLYQDKPNINNNDRMSWWWSNAECMSLNKTEYPEVTFENSPQEVELKLKSKI